MNETVRVGSPTDILGLVPYLLNFPPRESLVVVLMSGGRLRLTMRVDLAEVAGAQTQLREVIARHDLETAVLIGYSASRPEAEQALWDTVEAVEGLVAIADVIYTDDRRWWSLICEGECCPPEGTPYAVAETSGAAQAVLAGLTTVSSRDELVGWADGPDEATRAALRAAYDPVLEDWYDLGRIEAKVDLVQELVRTHLASGSLLSTEEAILLALLVYEAPVRDAVLLGFDRETADKQVALWRQVVAVALEPFDVPVLGLLGIAAWLSGNGALQSACLERAEGLNPHAGLVSILRSIRRLTAPPEMWEHWRADLAAPGPDRSVA
ncbi:DUF4192 domain-containing protein [Granulicoccus phenolivorans]|uniref:DUF4192 domain-containing protein n=1 Tax=Granulicoccus phenolivorans TaxID=266854 RepID=UPI000423BBB9|nr:DUF4192 domain-containing protein [Granulicoccus phenolivorans]